MNENTTTLRVPATVNKVIWGDKTSNRAIVDVRVSRKSPHYSPNDYPADWKKKGNLCVLCSSYDEMEGSGGKPWVFVGVIKEHNKYGKQLQCSFCFVDTPQDEMGMREYLTTLPHVGRHRAKQLIKKFGHEDVGRIIELFPEKIISAKIGLTPFRMGLLQKKWIEDKALRETYLWLGQHGIGLDVGRKIVAQWGAEAIKEVEKDPYSLVKIKGISFKTADDVAFKVLETVDPYQRTTACLEHVLGEATANEGHLCLPFALLKMKAMELLITRSGGIDYTEYIQKSVKDSRFVVSMEGELRMIYTKATHKAEVEVAQMLVKFSEVSSSFHVAEGEVDTAEAEISRFMNMDVVLSSTQKAGIKSSFSNKVTIITGGGGTGKSTICRCICTIARDKGIKVRQMAPTGKAAKVLKSKTDQEAMTIHRSLRMRPGEDPTEVIEEDIVIIDEFSMCGLDTVHAICWALTSGNIDAHLVLVGDHQQLPSVSPGNFLADIMASGIANVVKLEQIYRQDEHSYIPIVADNIARGLSAHIPKDATDIRLTRLATSSKGAEIVKEIISRSCDEKGIDLGDMHVMASQHKGDCGVRALNWNIQEMVASRNGNPDVVATDNKRFFVGDKVMQRKNNYDRGVFNGDMGVVITAGRKVFYDGDDAPTPDDAPKDTPKDEKPTNGEFSFVSFAEKKKLRPNKENDADKEPYVVVRFEDDSIPDMTYRKADLDELMIAWCTTVHKFQGSQCKYIIFLAPRGHYHMLTRELVYTAITRAEKKVIVIGDERTLSKSPSRSVASTRFTCLVNRIKAVKNRGLSD